MGVKQLRLSALGIGGHVPVFAAALWAAALLGLWLSSAAAAPDAATSGQGRELLVGPGQALVVPSDAAAIARNGDRIKIDASGNYVGDVARWSADNLYISGYNGRPHLRAGGQSYGGKALWVVSGDNIVIDNVEISGVVVADKNGAAIRHEGRGLTLKRVYFHHNESGLLTSNDRRNKVLIENSEIAYNGHGDGYSHNIYAGVIAELTVRFSYIHHAVVGHNIKSRAAKTRILYNRIMDEYEGESSYLIDIPYGGEALVMGNLLQQGRATENSRMLTFGAENLLPGRKSSLDIINNTFVNESRRVASFIWAKKGEQYPVQVANNLFYGPGKRYRGPLNLASRSKAKPNARPGPVDMPRRRDFNYQLGPAAVGIDQSVPVLDATGKPLVPEWEYRHRAAGVARPTDGKPDMGAYEYRPLVVYGSRNSWFDEPDSPELGTGQNAK